MNSGLVVFFVSLPLCLGIALASGAPPVAGIISGIIGGLVVGMISRSPLSVSGPAIGLTIIVLDGMSKLQSFETLLAAIFLMGVFQIILGIIRAGFIANLFPTSVIQGMLSGIGLVLILKQIPHAVGWDKDFEGDLFFFQKGEDLNTFDGIRHALGNITPGAMTVFFICASILFFWDSKYFRITSIKKYVSAQFAAVIVGVIAATFMVTSLDPEHFVQIPSTLSSTIFKLSDLANPAVYGVALVLAIVGSLETLLSVDAADKIDPLKRTTDMNRELIAQGVGNMTCGLLGGIPVTSVVVRTTTGISAGATEKTSTLFHGLFLALAVLLVPGLLNKIPLAALAAILILVGYKLCSVKVFKTQWKLGWSQFIPFIVTLIAVVFTDLLTGVGLGLLIGSVFILYQNTKPTTSLVSDGSDFLIRVNRDMTFLNKSELKKVLGNVADNSSLILELGRPVYMDYDIQEIFRSFEMTAMQRNISLQIHGPWPEGLFQRVL